MAVETLVRQQILNAANLTGRLEVIVGHLWDTVPGLDDAALERWLADVLPVVQGAQIQAGAGTAAYVAQAVAEMTGTPPRYEGVAEDILTGPRIRRGTPPEVVYQRPMAQARALISKGQTYTDAMARARTRAVSLVTTDVQSARLYAAQATMAQDARIQGYRRSLTGRENCGLCVVASTRRYHKADLMPRHPGCDCQPVPIVGGQDPGEAINRPLLDSLHQSVVDRFGPEAKTLAADTDAYRQLVTVYDHGEYGPTLVRSGDHVLRSASASARP